MVDENGKRYLFFNNGGVILAWKPINNVKDSPEAGVAGEKYRNNNFSQPNAIKAGD